jgi:hypothetical protein
MCEAVELVAVAFLKLTLTLAVAALPAASIARAVNVWEPSANAIVSTEADQLPVPEAAFQAFPSTLTSTAATPVSSDEPPDNVIVPEMTAPSAGASIVIFGAWVSTVFWTSSVMFAVDLFPDVSVARTVTACDPLVSFVVSTANVHDEVPFAELYAPPSSEYSTDATATSSVAVPLTWTVALTVAPFDGPSIVSVGGVVSVTHVFVLLQFP